MGKSLVSTKLQDFNGTGTLPQGQTDTRCVGSDFAQKPSYCSEFERRCVVCEQ